MKRKTIAVVGIIVAVILLYVAIAVYGWTELKKNILYGLIAIGIGVAIQYFGRKYKIIEILFD
ncbi:MAG: hypothetical protein [Siphoviridae sp. ctjeG17]|nr:MAG: hypothetical protein [Siphoviridae sp. ctjeG17]